MAADPQTGALELIWAALSKILPGLLGAVIALQWQPAGASKLDGAIAALSGFAAAYYLSPLVVELVGITSLQWEYGISFLVGLFSMAIAGQIMLALKGMELGSIVRDFVRKTLRIDK